jgi:hypothetical protein
LQRCGAGGKSTKKARAGRGQESKWEIPVELVRRDLQFQDFRFLIHVPLIDVGLYGNNGLANFIKLQ